MNEDLKKLVEDTTSILKFEDGSYYQCLANKNHLIVRLSKGDSCYPNNAYVVSLPEELHEMSYEIITCKDVVEVFGYGTPPRRSLVTLDDSVDWVSMDKKMSDFSKTLVNIHKTS